MNKSLKEEMRTIYRPEENLAIPPEYPRANEGAGTKHSQGKMKGNNKQKTPRM